HEDRATAPGKGIEPGASAADALAILPTSSIKSRMPPCSEAFCLQANLMIHEIFPVGILGCNCSVIGDEQTREGIVIDPGDDIQNVLQAVRKHGLTIKQIIITHAHIDHVGGAMKLRGATGAPILLNKRDY